MYNFMPRDDRSMTLLEESARGEYIPPWLDVSPRADVSTLAAITVRNGLGSGDEAAAPPPVQSIIHQEGLPHDFSLDHGPMRNPSPNMSPSEVNLAVQLPPGLRRRDYSMMPSASPSQQPPSPRGKGSIPPES